MQYQYRLTIILLFLLAACSNKKKETTPIETPATEVIDTLTIAEEKTEVKKSNEPIVSKETIIPFLQQFERENKERVVRVTTEFGSFEITLNNDTPYHRANMIFLAKQNYYNDTQFHRVAKGFVIQGGSSDNPKIGRKRRDIGRYVLPPEFRKNHKHRRGAVSMPSSENDNPHKLSSPFEFFVVQAAKGSPHLDGSHTVFGYVTKGMNVVDKIANQPVDKQEWPLNNILMQVEIVK
ncbi:peptidylprolyl isomerase [Spongiivirga citrea]|uniref:Peptidyl-prolyl cis-trans isomerase n=1 Tax=Spongiivirga citrea TaxID=1481457 RepID=A0A6M0CVC3_9FLAO|nr:peptidylprolyl isomerase [Spongiivirga citrea]NER17720.1 peptidylprolyl isomerase [Spongiivirga citrea]